MAQESQARACRLVVVHRNAALLLLMLGIKLDKLREAETRASIGFAADFVA